MWWRGLVHLYGSAGCAAVFSVTQRDDAADDSVAGRRGERPKKGGGVIKRKAETPSDDSARATAMNPVL